MIVSRRTLMMAATGTIAVANASLGDGAKSQESTPRYAPLCPLYSCSTGQHKDLTPLMDEASKSFGGRSVSAFEQNPRCCVWFEIVGATSPGLDGWFMWHEAGGTIITATDVNQMKIAIAALVRIARTEAEQRLLPVGITTCFDVTRVS